LLAVVLSLLSAALYGGADFLGGVAARRATIISVTAISQGAGLALLAVAAPFFGGHPAAGDLAWGLLGGVFGGIGIAMLYHALSIGKMGVVSPITAVLAAVVPVGVGVVRGDPLHWFQFAGIGCALVAVVMISLSFENGVREIRTKGVKEAIISGIAIGGFFLVLGLSRSSAGVDTLLAARVGSVLFLLLLAAVTRTSLRPRAGTLPTLLAIGAVDMTANVLFVIAAQTGALAISAVLTSLYPASTVFLARAILKERLQLSQKIGVGLALVGVGLIAA
jgi:drug/metabolite transporter (DMT)-like permease